MVKQETQHISEDVVYTGLTAFTLIVYEVFLSRLFAVILDYNYAFLVVSLATLGIGLGGYSAYISYDRIRTMRYSLFGWFPISLIAVTFAIYSLSYQGILFYSFLALIPFFLGGVVLAGIMQTGHRNIHVLYFADLLGAGLGAAIAVWLMSISNPVWMMSMLSCLVFLVYLLTQVRMLSVNMKVFHTGILLLLIANIIYPIFQLVPFRSYETSPNNIFVKEKDAKIVFSDWNAFARTDVYDAGDGELLYITIDGGAVSPISKYSGDFRQVAYLQSTTASLAFQQASKGRVLLIGAGGGQEVLTAKMMGFQQIDALDINGGSFRAVQTMSSFSGNLFRLAGVTPIISDGRNYIRQTKNRYDLIFLSLVKKNSGNGLGLALTENYMFTQEAVKDYMNKLTASGRLAFLLHDEIELDKTMFAAMNGLREEGVPEHEMKDHLVVIGTYQHLGHVVAGMGGSQITRPLLLLSKQPFSRSDAEALFTKTKQIQQIPVHIPYVRDQFDALGEMLANLPVDVASNRDDKPFFYKKTTGVPKSLLWVLLLIFIFALAMSVKKMSPGQTIYFSGIAIGFMLLEVTLIQRFILFLGHPTLSFVVVLGVLLVSGGIGSYFSKLKSFHLHKRYMPLLLIGALALGLNVLVGWIIVQTFAPSLFIRILMAGGMLAPLGFFMGMPFPYGLKQVQPHRIAAGWGLNGITTVAGSVLGAFLSLSFRISATMAVGAVLYVALFALQPKLGV